MVHFAHIYAYRLVDSEKGSLPRAIISSSFFLLDAYIIPSFVIARQVRGTSHAYPEKTGISVWEGELLQPETKYDIMGQI